MYLKGYLDNVEFKNGWPLILVFTIENALSAVQGLCYYVLREKGKLLGDTPTARFIS